MIHPGNYWVTPAALPCLEGREWEEVYSPSFTIFRKKNVYLEFAWKTGFRVWIWQKEIRFPTSLRSQSLRRLQAWWTTLSEYASYLPKEETEMGRDGLESQVRNLSPSVEPLVVQMKEWPLLVVPQFLWQWGFWAAVAATGFHYGTQLQESEAHFQCMHFFFISANGEFPPVATSPTMLPIRSTTPTSLRSPPSDDGKFTSLHLLCSHTYLLACICVSL